MIANKIHVEPHGLFALMFAKMLTITFCPTIEHFGKLKAGSSQHFQPQFFDAHFIDKLVG